MRIAINAADLDHARIDGTRIYIQNLLKNFGPASRDRRDQFLIYHGQDFNPELNFPIFKNYQVNKLEFPFYWTQTRFAWEIFREKPEVLWMPMHSLPFLRSKKTKTVVTIHDLAFKFFPEHYPRKHLRRINMFTDYAANHADRLIAISGSTKNDLLRIYPKLREEKIKVIYHGYNRKLFHENISREHIKKIRAKYKIPVNKYLIYFGAIQPRKNIVRLIDAFESIQVRAEFESLKLVIAGDLGWMYKDIVERARKNPNIIATGKFQTEDLPALIAGAEAFVLPSLYEGFGLPLIEAMACGTPVATADNSSLNEIAGGAGVLFDPYSSENIADSLIKILKSSELRAELKEKGIARAKEFSWSKCAGETLEWLTKW